MQNPKHIFKPFRNRNKAMGTERRLNAVKTVLNHSPHFPKTLTYKDYDQTLYDWVDKELSITIDEKRLPTYKLFSNQRISEYGQNWQELDEKGNLEINFKTLTRENNPQHGENQGNSYNIPGNRRYPIFSVKVLEENGDEVTQLYSMKQPFSVNLIYNISIVTDKYLLLNEMNTKMLDAFKGLEVYIFPKGFAVPMLLNSVSDESDYMIDDRKYYAQTFQIKVLGYIIKEDDYEVKKVPSRIKMFCPGENSLKKRRKKFEIDTLDLSAFKTSFKDECKNDNEYVIEEAEVDYSIIKNQVDEGSQIEIEELNGVQSCFQGTDFEMSVNKKVVVHIPVNLCESNIEFKLEQFLELETLELKNIVDFKLSINNIEVKLGDSSIVFYGDDEIKVSCGLKDPTKKGNINLICFDPNSVIEEDVDEEDIYVE